MFRDIDNEAYQAGRRWGSEVQRGAGTVKMRTDADTTAANRAIDRVRAEQERRGVTMRVRVDDASLKGALGKLESAGKLNLGMVGVGALPAVATAAANVAGALQQLAGAGLAIPGVFAGVASSVGVATLGISGMKDALEAVSKASDGTQASVDAANKALAELSPNAANTVTTLAGLKGTFTDLRNIASQNMFAGVGDQIQALTAHSLPELTRGIDGISRGLNQNLTQALTSLGSDSSQGFLDRILGNTGDAQSRLTAAIDPVINAVGTLAAAGSDSLPRLADAVGVVAERFNAFISAADADGRLATWISEGLDGFTAVGNTVLNLGKSFTAITEAAGGGAGLLGTLESLSGSMSTFLNSAAGQDMMRQFFADGSVMLGQFRDIAVQLGPILSGVFSAAVNATGFWLPLVREGLTILNSMPVSIEAVATAFLAWRTISGISTLIGSLTTVGNLLGGLPGKANTAKSAIGGIGGAAVTTPGVAAVAVPALATAGTLALATDAIDPLKDKPVSTGPGTIGYQHTVDAVKRGEIPGLAVNDAGEIYDIKSGEKYLGETGTTEQVFGPKPPDPAPLPGKPEGMYRTRDGKLRPIPKPSPSPAVAAIPPAVVPQVSTYTPPVVTESTTKSSSAGSQFSDANLVPNAARLNDIIAAQFPQIREIGGYRANGGGSNDHPSGHALDIMVPGWDTAEGKALGDQINQFLHQNADSLGIDSTIWQDFWAPVGGGGKKLGREGANEGHYNHIHAKVKSGTASGEYSPVAATYPEMASSYTYDPTASSYATGDSKQIRDAQQKADDKRFDMEQAQRKLDELPSDASASERAAKERALAEAKREHADALEDLATAQGKYNEQAAKDPSSKGTGGEQLGADIVSGIMDIFGLGDIFPNPLEFGAFKGFKGLMGGLGGMLGGGQGAQQGGGSSLFPGAAGGGGGSVLGGMLSMIPKPFGEFNLGTPQDAPGQFMPGMRGEGGGGVVNPGEFLANPNSPAGAPGPGNNGYTVNFNGNNFGHSKTEVQDQVNSSHLQQVRQPLRALPMK